VRKEKVWYDNVKIIQIGIKFTLNAESLLICVPDGAEDYAA